MSSNLDVGPFGGGNTAVFQDVQASGVAGQTFSIATFDVIDFNTEVVPKSWVSLSSNQFTLDAGVYYLVFKPTWAIIQTNADLSVYDVNATTVIAGTKVMADPTNGDLYSNTIPIYLNLSSQVTFELRYYINGAITSIAKLSQGSEHYSHLSITKMG